jgi:hypothetical protein
LVLEFGLAWSFSAAQRVRLPVRFRFEWKDVQFQAMGPWLEAFYAENPLLPVDFLAERGDPSETGSDGDLADGCLAEITRAGQEG